MCLHVGLCGLYILSLFLYNAFVYLNVMGEITTEKKVNWYYWSWTAANICNMLA